MEVASSLGMAHDHVLNACIYKHVRRDLTGVCALILEIQVLCAYMYIAALYSIDHWYEVDGWYTVHNVHILILHKWL